ncbi:hypothetical protein [Mycobacteroides chelonae]|uniref:hypothetical protein n=1 Tax=Mycobacteroides chelonae TaxID=1774 RepID=UPI001E2C431F|nr:hypothetical protein [Mycobacteroides chelonae]
MPGRIQFSDLGYLPLPQRRNRRIELRPQPYYPRSCAACQYLHEVLLPPPRTINDLLWDTGQPFLGTEGRRRRHKFQARVALKLRQRHAPSLAGRIKEPHNSTGKRKHR